MPSGRVHHRIWKLSWALPLLVTFGVYLAGFPVVTLFVPFGYLLGAIVEPDLDQVGITTSEGYVLKSLGCFGSLWVAYWLPYGKVMPHRSFLSHFPGVSTAVRMAYLFTPLSYGLWRYGLWRPWLWDVLGGLWIGLTVSDTLHFVADTLSKESRR